MNISKSQAKELVGNIAKGHGHLDEAVYSEMTASARRQVEEALLMKDKLIGSTVITLAKNLYSKDVRFIFELLQNADDNHFGKASSASQDPYVAFRVYHDKIIVECNEDGFTELNLQAICNVGQSSKLGAQGYIGEKGIGFKSVFKVASKVWIQSEPFSFCFKHRPGESGMGMISPVWEETTEELAGPLTRMTFYLADDGDPAVRAEQRQNINEQLNDLRPEMLLFLKKLRRIQIHLHDGAGRETSSSVLSRVETSGGPNRAVLQTVKIDNGQAPRQEMQYYHVTKAQASGLGPNENRDYSAAEHARQVYSTADIILAFPLTAQSAPLIRSQQLFAFLPIRRVGFNFLIHSDFVTMANREDIVTSSLRNRGLCRQLATAFITAVKQMCEHPQLRFKWMAYLPSLTGSPADDPFWGIFVKELRDSIVDVDVVVPRAQPFPLRPIRQLRRLSDSMLDRHGNPLFDDLTGLDATDISRDYDNSDLDILQEFGLEMIHWNNIIPRVEADLRSTSSRMRALETDDDWHSRVSRLFIRPLISTANSLITRVKALTLVPLCNGAWVDTANHTVQFPTTVEGFAIPRGLGLHVIDPQAASRSSRRGLFLALGAEVPSAGNIRALILRRIGQQGQVISVDKDTSIAFLRFLYLTHPGDAPANAYNQVKLLDTAMEFCAPFRDDMYLRDDTSSYGPAKLGLAVKYLHSDYLHVPPVRSGDNAVARQSWRQWLRQSMGVRKRLRLACRDGTGQLSLTREVQYVAEHLPAKFLGLLHSLWPHEGAQVRSNAGLIQKLRMISVLCDGEKKACLGGTILPLPHLKLLAARFMDHGEVPPFLKLETTLVDGNLGEWEFLKRLGVISNDKVTFHLTMVKTIAESTEADRVQRPSRLLDLYTAIYAQCTSSTNPQMACELARDAFDNSSYIFIPRRGNEKAVWCSTTHCLLSAPADMEVHYPVDAIYSAAFGNAATTLNSVISFFRDILIMPRCSWRSFIEELEYLNDCESTDGELIARQYERLNSQAFDAADLEGLRKLFVERALIFDNSDVEPEWHTLEYCIWSSASSIWNKTNLATPYPTLEAFFVGALGVQKLNLSMVYDELLRWSPEQTTVEDVKEQLWSFNSLLGTDTLPPNQTPLRLLKKSTLPIRYPDGQVYLRAADIEFAIIDHKALGDKFGHKVKTLDFNDREVRSLKPFLKWAGLEDRYISRTVKETATLGSDVKVPVCERRYDISKKAHGLLRIATHLGSPRLSGNGQEFYDLLRSSETWETDGISSQLGLRMDGQSVTIEQEQGDVYIDEQPDGPLKIYIPHDEGKQDECIQSTLPKMLVQWIMTKPRAETAPLIDPVDITIVTGLVNAKPLFLKGILDKGGIVDVDIPNLDIEDEGVRGVASAPAALGTPPRSPSESSGSVVDVFTPGDTESRNGRWDQETPLTDPFLAQSPDRVRSGYFSRTHPSPEPQRQSIESRALYRELLDHVVQAGRRIRFPSQGGLDMSALRAALPGAVGSDALARSFAFSRFTTFEIGAAGELFVFELLLRLNPPLPGFTRGNWTSGIRTLVNTHQDYESMARWSGRYETSDLEYNDTNGVFTNLLIEQRYLPSDQWQGKTPKYHFEVKSTPQELEAPFFMSATQYGKMKALSVADDTIYIIFRVFNLYSNEIDLRLYVNPPELEREGKLEFSAEKYTVRVLS